MTALIDCSRSRLFTHVGTSPLPLKDLKNSTYARPQRSLSRKGSLSCRTCYDMGRRFLRTHSKERLVTSYNKSAVSGDKSGVSGDMSEVSGDKSEFSREKSVHSVTLDRFRKLHLISGVS